MEIDLTDDQKIKVTKPNQIFLIMQQILLRENEYSRNREHFWVVGLDIDNTILYIELVSIGDMEKSVVDPKEVFRVGILKFARYLILVHNHPFGHLEAGENDLTTTNLLIHAATLVRLQVIDHIIINTKEFSSFGDKGLMEMLEKSDKFLTAYMKDERYKAEIKKNMKIEKADDIRLEGFTKGIDKGVEKVAIVMKKNKIDIELIAKSTGLSKTRIDELSIS